MRLFIVVGLLLGFVVGCSGQGDVKTDTRKITPPTSRSDAKLPKNDLRVD
jgi:hypothetical protein